MTKTIVTPITLDTGCPSWCTEHAWYGGGEGEESHHNAPVELTYPPFQNDPGERQFTVTPYREINADGTVGSHVFVNDCANGILATRTEVGELIAALREAAAQAFGAGATRDDGACQCQTYPSPEATPCPAWCEVQQPHEWVNVFGNSWSKTHRKWLDSDPEGTVTLQHHELIEDGQPATWGRPGDAGRMYFDLNLDTAQSINDGAELALTFAEGVKFAVDNETTEDTPAIRRVLAERAVLDAVRDWIDGDGRTTAVENAYGLLVAALVP